jgi:hypothetical protein
LVGKVRFQQSDRTGLRNLLLSRSQKNEQRVVIKSVFDATFELRMNGIYSGGFKVARLISGR